MHARQSWEKGGGGHQVSAGCKDAETSPRYHFSSACGHGTACKLPLPLSLNDA